MHTALRLPLWYADSDSLRPTADRRTPHLLCVEDGNNILHGRSFHLTDRVIKDNGVFVFKSFWFRVAVCEHPAGNLSGFQISVSAVVHAYCYTDAFQSRCCVIVSHHDFFPLIICFVALFGIVLIKNER